MTDRRLTDLLKDMRVAMLTTLDEEGLLRSRPVTPADLDREDELWFFISASAYKADEVGREQRVNICYANPDRHNYVSVSGVATVSYDRERVHKLWKPRHRAWFPKGEHDADLVLLRVQVRKAEYWDAPGKTVAGTIGMMMSGFGGPA
jgi:general stress protein 26